MEHLFHSAGTPLYYYILVLFLLMVFSTWPTVGYCEVYAFLYKIPSWSFLQTAWHDWTLAEWAADMTRLMPFSPPSTGTPTTWQCECCKELEHHLRSGWEDWETGKERERVVGIPMQVTTLKMMNIWESWLVWGGELCFTLYFFININCNIFQWFIQHSMTLKNVSVFFCIFPPL